MGDRIGNALIVHIASHAVLIQSFQKMLTQPTRTILNLSLVTTNLISKETQFKKVLVFFESVYENSVLITLSSTNNAMESKVFLGHSEYMARPLWLVHHTFITNK